MGIILADTLFLKLLYVDYAKGAAIIEFIGEWNDCVQNDIMFLKRDFIDVLIQNGIGKICIDRRRKYLSFFYDTKRILRRMVHEDIKDNDGWIIAVNFREHVMEEMLSKHTSLYPYQRTLFN